MNDNEGLFTFHTKQNKQYSFPFAFIKKLFKTIQTCKHEAYKDKVILHVINNKNVENFSTILVIVLTDIFSK